MTLADASDETLQAIALTTRNVLEHHWSTDALRRSQPGTPVPEDLWRTAAEHQWFSVAVPEQLGGLGESMRALGVVLEELGRALVPGPWIGTAVAAMAFAGTPLGQRSAEGLPVGLALDQRALQIRLVDGSECLDGTIAFVPEGADVDVVILGFEGQVWTLEDCDAIQQEAVDPAQRLATLNAASARAAARPDVCLRDITTLVDLLVAATALGIARGAFDHALAYARVRHQFGRPIASFQAIQHRLADMLLDLERATALTAEVLDSGLDASERQVLAARYLACDAARTVTKSAILVLGGIGFTWEDVAHRYFKRAHTMSEFRCSQHDCAQDMAMALERELLP